MRNRYGFKIYIHKNEFIGKIQLKKKKKKET